MTTLISDEYKSEQFNRHVSDPEYGGECLKYVSNVSGVINRLGVEEVLDYGSGKGELAKNLELDHRVKVFLYDPAIPKIDESPDPAQMVVCINVMEYVEPDLVENVLDDIKRCTKEVLFIAIKGRVNEWLPKILSRFELASCVSDGETFFVIAYSERIN
jgi:uncharacterized protein YlzI (FlbEa/FlbD family)